MTDFLYSIFVGPFADMIALPDFLMQVLWEGFVAGVLYALIALGFVLIFKASGVFNFAQGIMVVFSGDSWTPKTVNIVIIPPQVLGCDNFAQFISSRLQKMFLKFLYPRNFLT